MAEQTANQERHGLFQRLKPCCVKISQLAIQETGSADATRELLHLTAQVLDILDGQIQKSPSALDDKLAEYVFFPLYHIFRRLEHYPARLTENCVKCLQLLIINGWKSKISCKLVQQIFSFLTFIIDGVPGLPNKDRHVPEELQLEAFRTQLALLTTAGQSAVAMSGLTEGDSMPALGHGVTVMLDGAVDGITPQIQLEALGVLQALYTLLRDQAALANFLPGTVSSLVKLLSSPNRHKAMVLAKGLDVVQTVLTGVLGDMQTRSILAKGGEEDETQSKPPDATKPLTPAWVKATTAQVKVALSSMMKLRKHSSQAVLDALDRLCVSLLDECHNSLANCTTLLIETAIVLDKGENSSTPSLSMQTDLRHLVIIYPELGNAVKTAVYSWMSSLARIVQLGNEEIKITAIHNLSKGIELFRSSGIESSTLEDSMGSALRDSIVSLVQSSKQTQPVTYLQLLDGSQNQRESVTGQSFEPVLMASESQRTLRREVDNLISHIASTSVACNIAANMMDNARDSESTDRIASLWLCFELVKASHGLNADSAAFLDLSAVTTSSDDTGPIFEDLFSYSVQILESHADSDHADWQLEAISLEVAAYAAQRRGISFRPDLMDVLFPVATFLGSENPLLQQHAIASLNSIALACQYASVSELIIDNVDYMVNSVALRLNSLDISPASMQVLMMMIRLSGPKLIPYLNDVVESIFAALENYHGYVLLAENLFSVLKEIVDQASAINERLLTDGERKIINHKKKPRPILGLDALLDELDRRQKRRIRDDEEAKSFTQIKGHPKEPWKSHPEQEEEEKGEDDEEGHPPPEPEKRANSPTYQLLLRIASLTQHYLTSPTPRLRRSLLELLTTASPVLSGDEDSFLPLINSIWPMVIERLRDPEPFIRIEACRTLVSLCRAAGDFLSTRFKTEWGEWLRDWCRKMKVNAEGRKASSRPRIPEKGQGIMIPVRTGNGIEVKGLEVNSRPGSSSGSLGQHASPVKMWEAVVMLLTAVVEYVRVDDAMFEDILDILADVMESNKEVREALEVVNADAVWLVRYEKGRVDLLPAPVVDGFEFVEMERLPRS
ncbi:HEAT repeat protein [Metarhizium album ARSEF 1941]|uniref:HEAT repeat protein n=1 Tax=Metarhizium album (strain ARSEF 1941) TaxID=1081103 RepID=A0A0B2X5D9_METAS|nr:HEAT repeat protein [Metarhizium album ARSEF 1941]KHO00670.1 HEAT repeat protein [Metarhizium album ARSEF 1941]